MIVRLFSGDNTIEVPVADNIKDWRKDVVALMKELESPVYMWPGGNFVSGYNWRDGIWDCDKKPPRKNPEVTIVESACTMKKHRFEVPSYTILLLIFEI